MEERDANASLFLRAYYLEKVVTSRNNKSFPLEFIATKNCNVFREKR